MNFNSKSIGNEWQFKTNRQNYWKN